MHRKNISKYIYNTYPKNKLIILYNINKIFNESLDKNNILDKEYINCYDDIKKDEKDKFLEK